MDENRLEPAAIEMLALDRFNTPLQKLNKLQASSLIDELIEAHGGKGGNRGGQRAYAGRGGGPMIAPASHPESNGTAKHLPEKRSTDPLEYISASRLKNFLSCRLRFFFEKVLDLPRPLAPNLHIGRAVHEGLQHYNKARRRTAPGASCLEWNRRTCTPHPPSSGRRWNGGREAKAQQGLGRHEGSDQAEPAMEERRADLSWCTDQRRGATGDDGSVSNGEVDIWCLARREIFEQDQNDEPRSP